MDRINTVGELRALLTGLPDDATIRPSIPHRVAPQPGLYFIRFATGTCNPAFVEVHIEAAAYRVTLAHAHSGDPTPDPNAAPPVPTFTLDEIADAVERVGIPAERASMLAEMLALKYKARAQRTEAGA